MRRYWATRYGGGLLVLVALCAGLAAVIYRELDPVAEPAPAEAAPAAPAPTAAPERKPAAFALPPLASYAEVAERPIFSSTRRPPPPEAAQEMLGSANSFTLVGIVISDGGRTALIEHGAPPATARLKEGQSIEGWSLQSIASDRVVLLHGASQQELKLKDRSSATRQPGAPTPQPRSGRG